VIRRTFLVGAPAFVAGLAAFRAEAQRGDLPRIGLLTVNRADSPDLRRNFEAFERGLGDLGWSDGKNIVIERRYGEGSYDKLPELTAELIRLKVAAIVGGTTPLIRVVQSATKTIPVVMVGVLDPVEAGFVQSLPRPGGNITGLTMVAGPEIVGKQLELLKQVAPSASRVAVLVNPGNGAHAALRKEAERAARSLELRVTPVEVKDESGLPPAFDAMRGQRSQALLVLIDAAFFGLRARIADLAAAQRLPAMYGSRVHVDAGGLASYGASLIETWRRSAHFVDRILKGGKPADMPVEPPAKFEFVINARAAKKLGLTIPRSLLLRADQIVE
jgi:putative ABC transport system substrate-binding protein